MKTATRKPSRPKTPVKQVSRKNAAAPSEVKYPVQWQRYFKPMELLKNNWEKDFIWLHDAVNMIGELLFTNKWDGREIYAFAPHDPYSQPDIYKEQAEPYTNAGLTAGQCKAVEQKTFARFTNFADEKAAHQRKEKVLGELRPALAQDKIISSYVDSDSGEMPAVPKSVWLQEFSQILFKKGSFSPAAFQRHKGKGFLASKKLWPQQNDAANFHLFEREYPVLIKRDDFDKWLAEAISNSPKKKMIEVPTKAKAGKKPKLADEYLKLFGEYPTDEAMKGLSYCARKLRLQLEANGHSAADIPTKETIENRIRETWRQKTESKS